jgi:hypothetical protein
VPSAVESHKRLGAREKWWIKQLDAFSYFQSPWTPTCAGHTLNSRGCPVKPLHLSCELGKTWHMFTEVWLNDRWLLIVFKSMELQVWIRPKARPICAQLMLSAGPGGSSRRRAAPWDPYGIPLLAWTHRPGLYTLNKWPHNKWKYSKLWDPIAYYLVVF